MPTSIVRTRNVYTGNAQTETSAFTEPGVDASDANRRPPLVRVTEIARGIYNL